MKKIFWWRSIGPCWRKMRVTFAFDPNEVDCIFTCCRLLSGTLPRSRKDIYICFRAYAPETRRSSISIMDILSNLKPVRKLLLSLSRARRTWREVLRKSVLKGHVLNRVPFLLLHVEVEFKCSSVSQQPDLVLQYPAPLVESNGPSGTSWHRNDRSNLPPQSLIFEANKHPILGRLPHEFHHGFTKS